MSIAAWQAIGSFAARSNLRTWLVGILRFKIIDVLREKAKQPTSFSEINLELDQELSAIDDAFLFDAFGRWSNMPYSWWSPVLEPDLELQQKQTLHMIKKCLDNLPKRMGQVFLMREYLGFSSAEICCHLGLSTGNVRIILMRARLLLRTCLEWQMRDLTNTNHWDTCAGAAHDAD